MTDEKPDSKNVIDGANSLLYSASRMFKINIVLIIVSVIALFGLLAVSSMDIDVETYSNAFLILFLLMLFCGFIIFIGSMGHRTAIKNWRKSFLNQYFSAIYDTLPVEGENNEKKLLNLIFNLYPYWKQAYEKTPDVFEFNETTQTGYTFDITIKDKMTFIAIKNIDKNELTDKKDLSIIHDELNKIRNKGRVRAIILSRTRFTEDAILYARKQDQLGSGISFDLVMQLPNNYTSIYIGKRIVTD